MATGCGHFGVDASAGGSTQHHSLQCSLALKQRLKYGKTTVKTNSRRGKHKQLVSGYDTVYQVKASIEFHGAARGKMVC